MATSKFIKRFIIFTTPVFIVLLVGLAVSCYTGEAFPFSYLAYQQMNNRDIQVAVSGGRNRMIQYKLESALIQQPELMILGASRALQYREHIAHKCPRLFYNAAFHGGPISELQTFLTTLIEFGHTPDVMLLSLEYPDFNQSGNYRSGRHIVPQMSNPLNDLKNNLGYTIFQVIKNPSLLPNLNTFPHDDHIGIEFVKNPTARSYRGDGSDVLVGLTEENIERRFQVDWKNLEKQLNMYQAGQEVNLAALDALDTLLKEASANKIQVIGFFPPYHSKIRAHLDQNPDYVYIPKALARVRALFEAYDFPFYDFKVAEDVGGVDRSFYDGWHPSQLLSVQIYITLLHNNPELLSPYSDIDYLTALVDSNADPIYIEMDRDELIADQTCSAASP